MTEGYNKSAKVEGIRRAWQEKHPETAAEQTAHIFEREAIAVPTTLAPMSDAPLWETSVCQDAGELYRSVVIAAADGVSLTGLAAGAGMGKQRFDAALRKLRCSGAVSESSEVLPDNVGAPRTQVVLRAALPTDA